MKILCLQRNTVAKEFSCVQFFCGKRVKDKTKIIFKKTKKPQKINLTWPHIEVFWEIPHDVAWGKNLDLFIFTL